MKLYTLITALLVACLTHQAHAAQLTGDPSADSGWNFGGNSLANGTYVRGEGTFGYDIYSTAFTVSAGSSLDIAAGSFSWLPGDEVIGLGGKFVDITATEAGWPAFQPNPYSGGGVAVNDDVSSSSRPVAKFGTVGSSFSTSTTAPFLNGNGNGSISGGAAADGTILARITVNRSSGGAGALGLPDLVQRYDAGGNVALANTGTAAVNDANFVNTARLIYTWDSTGGHIDGWQYVINTSLMDREFNYSVYPEVGDQAVMTVQRGTNRFTDGLVNTAPIPEPGSLALLGMSSLALLFRRNRR